MSTNTGENRRKPGTFVKGDPRINRNGRPKSFDALRKLAQQLAHEEAQSKGVPIVIDGHKATNAEMILRDLMRAHPERFLEIAFGKVPNTVELSGKDGAPINVKAYIGISPDDWDGGNEPN